MTFASHARTAVLCISALLAHCAPAQDAPPPQPAELHAHLEFAAKPAKEPAPAAVVWLTALSSADGKQTSLPEHFTLAQKNRMFTSHLLVVPVGSVVSFPNLDPFYHNVFSLFNGKRFDLGLYEAGKSKDVVFSREGVSYIFCNIHPQMSAVVLSVNSQHYAIADRNQNVRIADVPPGDYDVHVWIEGLAQASLDHLVRRIHLAAGKSESISLDVRNLPHEPATHLNKFGEPYPAAPDSTY
jgi:plastocyanin